MEDGDFIWNPPSEEAHIDDDDISDGPAGMDPCRGSNPRKVHIRDTDCAEDTGAGMKYMKNVYQTLIENLTNERLDQIVFQDKDAFLTDKKLNEVLEQYHKMELPEKDTRVIDMAFELYAEQCAQFVHAAYKQGMEDAVQLLKEMGVFGKQR